MISIVLVLELEPNHTLFTEGLEKEVAISPPGVMVYETNCMRFDELAPEFDVLMLDDDVLTLEDDPPLLSTGGVGLKDGVQVAGFAGKISPAMLLAKVGVPLNANAGLVRFSPY